MESTSLKTIAGEISTHASLLGRGKCRVNKGIGCVGVHSNL